MLCKNGSTKWTRHFLVSGCRRYHTSLIKCAWKRSVTKTTSSAREYPLTDEQLEMFQRLRDREIANRKLCGNGYYDSEYIFKHVDGSLYYPDYPTKSFGRLMKRIPELPQNITFHGLRASVYPFWCIREWM